MKLVSLASRARKHGHRIQPVVENLEGRLLLYATSGDHFSNGNNMTISFVPDGTDLGGVKSNLFATFDKTFGANKWEPLILDAAAGWEADANINFTQVSDNGAAIGSGSYQQGNPNFGDIRIGGFAQNASSLAYTITPPPANGDSSSGDIFFNTAAQIGGQGGYDLETLATHEFGHALGLAHSTDQNAAMYASYYGTKKHPVTDDINGIQAIWGPRANDAYTQKYNNTSIANAVDLTSQINAYGQIGIPNLNVANYSTAYYFKVTTPANASNQFAAIVQSTGYSLLSPQVMIFTPDGNTNQYNMGNPSAYGTTMGTQINNATPNTTYYIKVLGDNNGANGLGAYGLLINTGNYAPGPVNPTVRTVPVTTSQGGGTSALSVHAQPADHDDFASIGTLKSSGDKFLLPAVANHTHRTQTQIKLQQSHPTYRSWAHRQLSGKQHKVLD